MVEGEGRGEQRRKSRRIWGREGERNIREKEEGKRRRGRKRIEENVLAQCNFLKVKKIKTYRGVTLQSAMWLYLKSTSFGASDPLY